MMRTFHLVIIFVQCLCWWGLVAAQNDTEDPELECTAIVHPSEGALFEHEQVALFVAVSRSCSRGTGTQIRQVFQRYVCMVFMR